MLSIIDSLDSDRWDSIVKSFSQWDIYYLCEYVASSVVFQGGEPLLLYFHSDEARLCMAIIKNDIARDDVWEGRLNLDTWFDLETPYGYGGPLFEGVFDDKSIAMFQQELFHLCRDLGIVSCFIRFHPLLKNQLLLSSFIQPETRKDTVAIQLTSQNEIWDNLDSKNRNMLRKAQNSGVEIVHDTGERIEAFIQLYYMTMDRNHASKSFYFCRDYFDKILRGLDGNLRMFYAVIEGKIISAAMFLYNASYMHYHLSGTDMAYKAMAPSNMLLFEAAKWGCEQQIPIMHLGGGIVKDDSLFGFKKQFSKNGILPFYIGRCIFNQSAYELLLDKRCLLNPAFERNNMHMIQYRR